MIKPNELRAGNLVLLTETTFKDDGSPVVKSGLSIVDGVQIYCESFNNDEVKRIPISAEVYINDKRVGLDEIQPIPLNEEWLLKFGFEQTDKRRKWVFTLKSKGFKFFINCNGSFCVVKGTGMRVENMNVHNLQNLYFALINEELTIK